MLTWKPISRELNPPVRPVRPSTTQCQSTAPIRRQQAASTSPNTVDGIGRDKDDAQHVVSVLSNFCRCSGNVIERDGWKRASAFCDRSRHSRWIRRGRQPGELRSALSAHSARCMGHVLAWALMEVGGPDARSEVRWSLQQQVARHSLGPEWKGHGPRRCPEAHPRPHGKIFGHKEQDVIVDVRIFRHKWLFQPKRSASWAHGAVS